MVKASIGSLSLALVCVSQIFGKKINFTLPNKVIVNDPGYGKKIGKVVDYIAYLNKTNDSKFPKVGGDQRTFPGDDSDAKFYICYAGASYCLQDALQSWDCTHCSQLNEMKLYTLFSDPQYRTQGIVALDSNRKEIVVSFHGSTNLENWIQNLQFDKTEFEAASPDAQVHFGFKNMMDALQSQFNRAVTNLLKQSAYKNYNLVVVGHSLSGALATLAAPYIQQATNLDWSKIQLFTYNQPRVGNPDFANWYNDLPFSVFRITNDNDLTPHTPPMAFNYQHQHTEVYIEGERSTFCATNQPEDPDCSNSRVPFLSNAPHKLIWGIQLGIDAC